MPIPVITSIISAVSIIAGSLLGALFSYIISSKMHKKQIYEEHLRVNENRKYEEGFRRKEKCINANTIRLDIVTAIFQSIRLINDNNEANNYLYLLPVNKDYANKIASLGNEFTLSELNLLYQLYGIIEKTNKDIYNWNLGDNELYKKINISLKAILYKIYGENIKDIIYIDIDNLSYKELLFNNIIKKEYKKIFLKLENLCEDVEQKRNI